MNYIYRFGIKKIFTRLKVKVSEGYDYKKVNNSQDELNLRRGNLKRIS